MNLKRVISLGYQPLANNLLKTKNQKDETFPLEMNYCSDCHNCQLSIIVDPKKMFSNYLYLSSTSKSFREHFENVAKKYIDEFKLLPKKSYIIDVGSNDGVALKPFKNLKFKNLLGIEPAKNLARIANKEKIKTTTRSAIKFIRCHQKFFFLIINKSVANCMSYSIIFMFPFSSY